MNLHHVLFFCFFSALCGGNSGLVEAEIITATGTEGKSVTVRCYFSLSGSSKLFCKGECTKENILIKTTADRDYKGRYSIEYEGKFLSSGSLYVTIRQLRKSDSGRYKCGLMNAFTELYQDVDLTVLPSQDAATTSSTSSTPSVTVPDATPQVAGYVWLPLGVCVPVVVLLLVVVVLLIYKVRKKRNFDGLNTRGNLDERNMKTSPYENCPPGFKCEDHTYQSLSPASRDQDQIYSIITHTQHT
ncbi:uncharacterized protein LOC108902134 isoform X5 [Lates calcarifer]|uniref:Uncharacterized protein LOC108902134 isoform X1 n=1 Tax=Lates calcarifer TaxID=8187 RepID=A0AAJ8B383_LATCA|nr:uncharacterized protein LOC108902134 isoform X1 [Lates calcarifer]XP_018559394.1 uncharacterized protein LOC108902134 isoform X3 [Lates calcarifer]XP_018559395.1 uncharacterized protein LOC108902134 isoform X6 [Lates calcarifer]XP_050924458.1 uncharacterized protein LOC108902134 isoform X2 [Lates calcarifer]XP_050924459.1 uncharacterized protein LOC108902134 isoform X4 [Lates calcarifer]XP_050924460.1 uncharacterized protein LOC108902134 isoform X5 [Lates calcarifer]